MNSTDNSLEPIQKKTSSNYFDQSTEDAIVRFQREPDLETKKQIFVSGVRPAFTKLVENIIYVYKFHTIGDIEMMKNDCMSFLFETLYKFDVTKGHKAFSYFNVIAKHWFIQKVKIHKKRTKSDVYLDKTLLSQLEKVEANMVEHFEEDILDMEYLLLLKEEVKKWRSKFDKKQEKLVLEAIILLLENPDIISIYNKKGIYLYIREITGLNTKQVVTNLSKIRKKYDLFKKKYHDGEV